MALTESTMPELGFKAPAFELIEPRSGLVVSLESLKSERATVVMFLCNHCPFVKHIIPVLTEVSQNYKNQGVSFIGISSNDIDNYPEDAPDKMRELAEKMGFSFPYLYDETQAVAKAYDAACTPDFFIFDGRLSCVYRGRFDASSPGNNVPVTGDDLTAALDQLLKNESVSSAQKPSLGCSIKWKN